LQENENSYWKNKSVTEGEGKRRRKPYKQEVWHKNEKTRIEWQKRETPGSGAYFEKKENGRGESDHPLRLRQGKENG